jgi:hypothetical protein
MNKQTIKHLLKKDNPVIFEIGCADGKDTQEFIITFNDVEIYCFEPEPKNIKIVKDNIKYSKHHLYEGVVSNIDGKLIFNRSRSDNPDDLCYSGSIKKPKKHIETWPFIKFDQQIEVNSTKLDTFCEINNIEYIDFIWADVQGAEEDLILSGKNSFEKNVKYFYTEYSNEEYYSQQANLSKILSLLGDSWELVYDFKTDVLLKNKNL